MTSTSTRGSVPVARSDLAAVAVPSEHGGWGLTAEPVLLGLLVAPGWAGLCLGVAALVAFMARTPLKVLLVDAYRDRRSRRGGVAGTVLAVEVVVISVLVLCVTRLATGPGWWWPLVAAGPLVALELWFDMRSRSRRLVPELAGSVGIASVAAAVAVAGGGVWPVAVGLWLVLAGRACTSIPYVRGQITRLHGHAPNRVDEAAGDVAAVLLGVAAVLTDRGMGAGAVALLFVVGVQRQWGRFAVPAAKVLGLRQLALGLGLVAVTALGVHLI